MSILFAVGMVVGFIGARLMYNQARWNSEFALINARRKSPVAFIAGLNTER